MAGRQIAAPFSSLCYSIDFRISAQMYTYNLTKSVVCVLCEIGIRVFQGLQAECISFRTCATKELHHQI